MHVLKRELYLKIINISGQLTKYLQSLHRFRMNEKYEEYLIIKLILQSILLSVHFQE